MSRRTQIIEEFDDDTDLPLPNQPLPNTGAKGPLLEEILISDDDDRGPSSHAGPASPSRPQARASGREEPRNSVTDITPYKSWTCIYPIYIDAKRPYATGERRVKREKSVWWPLSKDIAEATNRLGLGTLHEMQKAHPRDWENPGRVRVLWKKDGRLVNPAITTKKQLLEAISRLIQLQKPDTIPKPPYITSAPTTDPPASETKTTPSKGKQPAMTKSKSTGVPGAPPLQPKPSAQQSGRRKLPVPPELPPLSNRVSPYSPALASGILIDAVKAGMNAQETHPPGAPGAPGTPGGIQKGKRKVVRVRG
ncbi:hypothetical protein HGRIS_000237 [Hohenbuehelia grisea]|uniref:Signal recognition particle, SRP19 subunit n=1 Tax=Hohenbuehelia grisea TaxID=104357 RepID=A0ABR3JR20_9AGAR